MSHCASPVADAAVVEGSGHTNLMEEPELSADVVIRFFKGERVHNA